MNPLLANAEVDNFLSGFPSASRRRGKHYFADGAVLSVECFVPGREYGAVVRGSEDYEVAYDYDPDAGAWESFCTCDSLDDCKHAFAGMLALQANAVKLEARAAVATNGDGNYPTNRRSNGTEVSVSKITNVPRQPQPRSTPVYEALRTALGRPLDLVEADFVRRVQSSFNEVQRVGYATFFTLWQLSGHNLGDTWQRLDLWPRPPRDDLQFWLYCAWHFRKLELPLPEFMLPVTDLSPIEPEMKSWDRSKQIQSWQARLKASEGELEDRTVPLDLRLMIFPNEARVQWRRETDSKFKDLKATHWRRLVNEYGDATAILPAALPLWLAIHDFLGDYDFRNLSYEAPDITPVLNAILQIPALAEKVVDLAEQPLARPAERLQYRLDPARDEFEDYSASLVLPDGSAPPEILAAVPGPPALYLTASAVYQGPPPRTSLV